MDSEAFEQSESPKLGRTVLASLALSTACQLVFLVLVTSLDPWLPIALRVLGSILPIPLSAAAGAVFLRKRHPSRSLVIPILLFVFSMVFVAAITAFVDAITGNYDLP